MNRATANVSVEWLMKNVGQSIDVGQFDIEYLLQYKLGWDLDYNSAAQLSPYYERLADRLLEEGFTKPICVYMETPWEGDGEVFAQGNGHHRLCLAVLLALDYIPVVFSFDGEYMHSDLTGD